MKYRKKPVVVEAMQWDGSGRGLVDLEMWAYGLTQKKGYIFIRSGKSKIKIKTLEGRLDLSPGDFVIRGIEGEFYPCKDSIFRSTYEPVTDAGPVEEIVGR
jgi:hypothetical protein